MRTNNRSRTVLRTTHEGGPASPHISAENQLRRLVMACLLFEDQFYVNGVAVADQIEAAAALVDAATLSKIAIEARNGAQLRHVPLLLADIMTKPFPDLAGRRGPASPPARPPAVPPTTVPPPPTPRAP